MNDPARRLLLDMLAWIADRPRTYREAMDAWRSSCPRHPVWDDAVLEGLVEVGACSDGMDASLVRLTMCGRAMLDRGGSSAIE